MSEDPRDEAAAPQKPVEQLLGELRARLHRYCARMTGSVIDGTTDGTAGPGLPGVTITAVTTAPPLTNKVQTDFFGNYTITNAGASFTISSEPNTSLAASSCIPAS